MDFFILFLNGKVKFFILCIFKRESKIKFSSQAKEVIEKMGKAQFFAFKMTHFLMYALFFIIPLSGWIYSSLAGFPIVVFGVLPIPDLVTPNKELADAVKPIHAIGAWSLVILIVLHVGAALKHQFIDKDKLISRMNPFSKK